MFFCCRTNKKPKNTKIPIEQSIKQPKYQMRVNDQDHNSTNLTNLTNFNEAINDRTNLSEVEKFLLDDKRTREQERDLIMKLIELPEKTHLIEFNWAMSYTNFIKEEGFANPQQIANKILAEKIIKKEDITSEKDYVLVNEQVWNVLVNLYGGGPMLTLHDLDRKSDNNILDQSLKVFASPSMNDLDKKQYRLLQQMPGKEMQIVGLENEIFFCYLNSVLQCLMGIAQLNYYFLFANIPENKLFGNAYQVLLRRATKSHPKARILAKELIKILQKQFSIYEMHDSSELLLFVLDKLREEMQKIECINFIDELFQGKMTSLIKCPYCLQNSTQIDTFYDLSLPLIGKNFMQRKLSIQECLNLYFKEENIEGTWTCSNCNKKSKNIKRKVKLSFIPNLLILQLKRFQSYPLQKKIKEPVSVDMELNLKGFCLPEVQDTKYALQSMIVHSGTIDSGHYVAVVRRNQQFYLFNDENIERLPREQVQRIDTAYLLLYNRIA